MDLASKLPRLSGPAWLASIGATMLLVASVIVVAGQWESIGPEVRFAGLVGSLLAIYFAAEAGRTRIPSTASALAVLAAGVTAPVGVAASAALEATWPICITVGGVAATVATELQSRRWNVRPLKAAAVIAVSMTVTGLAAVTSLPVALLGAGAATIALALGATRRSVALAALVPLVPLLELLARAGVGSGTLVRIGAVDTAAWVPPAASLVAGLVIAISAHRRSSAALATASLVAVAFGGVIGLVDAASPIGLWLAVPSGVVVLVELAAFVGDKSLYGRWAVAARPVTSGALAVAGLTLPLTVSLGSAVSDWAGDGSLLAYALPVSAAAGSLAIGAIAGRIRRTAGNDGWLDDLILVAALGAATATPAVFDIDLWLVAGLALGGWLVSTAATAWRHWVPVTLAHVCWAIVAAAFAGAGPVAFTAVVLTAAVMMITACTSSTSPLAIFGGIPITVLTSVVLIVGQWPDHLSAITAALAVLAVASTGLAMRSERFGPLDGFALATGVSALLVSGSTTPAGISLAVTLVAAQAWLYSVVADRADLAAVSAGTGVAALISLWWTTGTNQLVIDWLAPYGIDGQDLALCAASIALVLAGIAVRATFHPSTWLAYSPGLGTGVAWLLMSQNAADGEWATFGALLIGVVAVGVGGARRLGAPLVFGTVALGGTLLISAGPRLAAAPTWAWIAVGGIGLLVVAALVERSERPLLPLGDDRDTESLVESFCREFE
jgi:hypothetical protein